jgi:dimethylargininase
VVFPAEFPLTRERLEKKGIEVVPVAAGELAKAEGGVTCCSLIFRK